MQGRSQAGDAAIHFLGPGRLHIAGAQPRLDVDQRHAAIKSRQRRGHDRRRVALGHDAIGPIVGNRGVQPCEASGGHLGQRLVRRHHFQIAIDLNAEMRGHLVEHLAVLAGDANDRMDAVFPPAALVDQRGHFDGLGPGAERQQHA